MSHSIALLHGAGYVGGELVKLLHSHPNLDLAAITSRTYAGEPVYQAHPALRGQVNLSFSDPTDLDLSDVDAVVVAAEHGRGMHLVPQLLASGFAGPIVDLSADFRLSSPAMYTEWYEETHVAPDLIDAFVYGLPELNAPYASETKLIANPGCYATGLALALAPLAAQNVKLSAHVTACTGASGSGASPSAATHFPDRDGNVRAYSVLSHRHTAEVQQSVGEHIDLSFVPVSGPWTRGIWGTIHLSWPAATAEAEVSEWFAAAYADAPCVRLSAGSLPELRPVVGTPFMDIGWHVLGEKLVVGFALDNLLKGAASQAIQNLNLLLGLPETAGLLASPSAMPSHKLAVSAG
ncbi:N-acetyl-gamma-glutamyl-phosphate reductase [Longibacter salinarum]|nr:N-acetyl-gamma-glutamyl-phosphate reductase [Longibacter salinarum]